MTTPTPASPLPDPSAPMPARPVNQGQLARDQRLAEVTERFRQASAPVADAVRRDDIAEESANKAFENRVRIAFLSTKGATMAGWLAQREALLSDAVVVAKI